LENASAPGPFIYFVYSSHGEIKYIGKADERTVLYRWVRPDMRTGIHQWSHGTNSAKKRATVELIADEIRAGLGPVTLYFSNADLLRASITRRAASVGIVAQEVDSMDAGEFVDIFEHYLIHALQPAWNVQRKGSPPRGPVTMCGNFWAPA
jgi:hypothetical protein